MGFGSNHTTTSLLESDRLSPLNLCMHKGCFEECGCRWIFKRVGGWFCGCCREKDKIAKSAAKTCAGGNVLLERGHFVSSDEYEIIKKMVVKKNVKSVKVVII